MTWGEVEIGSMVSLRNDENPRCTDAADSLALVMALLRSGPVTVLMIVIL